MKNRSSVVLLATYNGAAYLPDFLDSLIAQNTSDFKVIVRDDGSSDASLDIIRTYMSALSIEILEASQRLGPALSFFELLKHAGDGFDCYFFADQDDYWHESKIARAVDKLSSEKENVGVYFSRLEYVDETLAHIGYSRIPRVIALENALVENIATGCTIALTGPARQLLLKNSPSRFSMHDWWCYIVVVAFGKVIYDTFPSIKYRQHTNNTIGVATNTFQNFWRRLRRFIRRDVGIYSVAMQATEFKRCFSDLLNVKQLKLVNSMTDGKAHIANRIPLVFVSKFVRQRWADSLMLRILFLMGRF
ncbi:MAG: glycosyl transferase, family 2 [Herbaspirillum sp.]|nr:glycosyl transferase, family 2 [Herbaspirillum sp.]